MNYQAMSPSDVLVAASLAQAAAAPIRDRIEIYRAVVATTADRSLANSLTTEADALEASLHRTTQLVLSFRARAETAGRA